MIKIDTNSIVQDASNQTEDNDDKDEDEEYANEGTNDENVLERTDGSPRSEDTARLVESSAADKADSSRKSKTKVDKAATSNEIVPKDTNPDFIGLQLLLSGIEHVEHGANNVTTNAPVLAAAKTVQENTADGSDRTANVPATGLDLLCALVDQRIQEEKKLSESSDLSSIDDDDVRPLAKSKFNLRSALVNHA